ncbi:MAG: hypothetical protein V8S95_00690 [Odoribacter sp.]
MSYNLKDRYARFLPIPVFKCEYGGRWSWKLQSIPGGLSRRLLCWNHSHRLTIVCGDGC